MLALLLCALVQLRVHRRATRLVRLRALAGLLRSRTHSFLEVLAFAAAAPSRLLLVAAERGSALYRLLVRISSLTGFVSDSYLTLAHTLSHSNVHFTGPYRAL